MSTQNGSNSFPFECRYLGVGGGDLTRTYIHSAQPQINNPSPLFFFFLYHHYSRSNNIPPTPLLINKKRKNQNHSVLPYWNTAHLFTLYGQFFLLSLWTRFKSVYLSLLPQDLFVLCSLTLSEQKQAVIRNLKPSLVQLETTCSNRAVPSRN